MWWTHYFGVIARAHPHFVGGLLERFGKAQGRPGTQQFESGGMSNRIMYDVKDAKYLSGCAFDSESLVVSTRQHVPPVRHLHTDHR
jgi:hypothetical protein